MSGGLGSDCSSEADDLLEIKERFKELTKEKEMLSDSKSQSLDLIRALEFHVKTLSDSREEDKKRIADLERELSNCNQEIDYLQDQLNMRSSDMEDLAEEVERLREEMKIADSERYLLMQELEDKEVVIRYSESQVEKLEESMSSMALEYQCEIESMKLESTSLEQNPYRTKKLLDERTRENSRMNKLIQDLEFQNKDAKKMIQSLEKENIDLKEKLQRSDMHIKAFVRKIEEQYCDWLGRTDYYQSNELEKNISTYGNVLGPLFSTLAIPRASDADLKDKMVEMSHQIDNYELLVKQLKEELREERMRAKEEAEDLAQEMAELRYQLTLMLDEECKRRASIEQISLQRITELEAQIAKERQKSISP